jgi:hypothetical protein
MCSLGLALHPALSGAQPNPAGKRTSPAAKSPTPTPVPSLSALQITPSVLGPDHVVIVALPPNYPLSNSRLRIGLFEGGRLTRVAEILRDFVVRDGRLQTTLTVQADPGWYDLRLITNDRAHTPFSQPAPLLVPGIRREPGWWLLNGTPFVERSRGTSAEASIVAPTVAPTNAPLFIPGLKRDLSKKPKKPSSAIPVSTNGPLEWKVLRLPSLRDMVAPGYNFAQLRATITQQIQEAQSRGERNYLGFELPTGIVAGVYSELPANINATVNQVRQTLQAVAPGSALILSVDAFFDPALAAHDIGVCGALCDAVALQTPIFSQANLWPLKAARRLAEDQPNYDLPIFVSKVIQVNAVQYDSINEEQEVRNALDLWMSGATGIIDDTGRLNSVWTQQVVGRNAPLFIGSVTLEDIGLLPAPDVPVPQTPVAARTDVTTEFYNTLRDVRRVPLLAHLAQDKKSTPVESFAVRLGDRISNATVEKLKAAASGGARIYIEGAPMLDENGQTAPWRLSPLVGGEAKTVTKNRAVMTLEDPWIFGTARGVRVDVEQTVTVTLGTGTMAGQAKTEKGKDVPTGPRVAARLEDGTPALITNPFGKGEVIWMPHRVLTSPAHLESLVQTDNNPTTNGSNSTSSAPNASAPAADSSLDALPLSVDRSLPWQRYYAAAIARVQSGLVQVRGTDRRLAGAEAVHVAMRRSTKGTLLLELLNTAPRPAAVTVTIDGVAGVALDLATETELPLSTRGYQSEAAVTVPSTGWKVIAFAETRKALDDERNASLVKARLR